MKWRLNPQNRQNPRIRNIACMYRFGITVALCFLFASILRDSAMAGTLRSLFWAAALVAAVMAAVAREHPRSRYLTRWDEAAGHVALSLITGFVAGSAPSTP